MDLKRIYNNKARFVVREIGDELILVPLTGNVAKMNEMFTMNETGKFIWENITETTTVEELEQAVTNEFSIDPDTARKDIELFLNQLVAKLNI
ncbi:MAG TPA: PqqD family protein [Paludibacter sp.]|nr:PqqD family protein [Paludibacter sp.]